MTSVAPDAIASATRAAPKRALYRVAKGRSGLSADSETRSRALASLGAGVTLASGAAGFVFGGAVSGVMRLGRQSYRPVMRAFLRPCPCGVFPMLVTLGHLRYRGASQFSGKR